MKITVVTPVFNDQRVTRALDSILAQQHGHELELLVVDAGSTDGTLDLLETYSCKISMLISEPDKGIYDGMNKGIRHATGDIIGILNADDQYYDQLVIRDMADAFSQEDIDVCYGDLLYTNNAGKVVRRWRAGVYKRRKWYTGWAPPHPTFFVRKRVYEQFGTFDLGYPIAADYEFMLRLLFKHKIKVKYISKTLVNMAPGGNSNRSISAIVKGNIEIAKAWRNNNLYGGFLVPILKPARKLLQIIPQFSGHIL